MTKIKTNLHFITGVNLYRKRTLSRQTYDGTAVTANGHTPSSSRSPFDVCKTCCKTNFDRRIFSTAAAAGPLCPALHRDRKHFRRPPRPLCRGVVFVYSVHNNNRSIKRTNARDRVCAFVVYNIYTRVYGHRWGTAAAAAVCRVAWPAAAAAAVNSIPVQSLRNTMAD